MIQRIQSIYLLLAGTAIILMLFFPIITVRKLNASPDNASLPHQSFSYYLTGKYDVTDNRSVKVDDNPLTMGIGMLTALSLFICILLFKNRELQLTICRLNLLLITVLMVLIFTSLNTEIYGADVIERKFEIGAFLPIMTAMFSILAGRAINKDEQMVRAADRIR